MDKTFLEDLIVELADGKELSPTNTTYRVDGDNLIIVKGNGGKMIDRQKAKRDIIKAAIDPRIKKIEFEIETLKAPQIDLDKFYEELTKPARDAEYRLDGDEVIIDAEKIGITVEKSQIKTALESNQEEYSIKVKTEMPKVTAKQLGELLFKDVMGKYSSNFATSSYSRATNVILTAERINGKILMPGDVFSYDSTIGKRTIQNGYKEAGVYVGNKVESCIGGGICQTSSTLYSAALYADLEIVNRTSHSLPVAYVPLGMDATIAEGYIDLKIKNNTPYPVKIEAIVSGRNLTCSFLGVKDPDKTIEVINTITEVYEPSTERTENPEIPKGYKNIINKGGKGYKVESSRIVKKQGEVIRTEKLVRSIYRAAPIEEEINPLDKETPSEMLKTYTPGMIVEEPQEEDVAETVTSGEELLEDETEKDQDAEVFDESIEDVNV